MVIGLIEMDGRDGRDWDSDWEDMDLRIDGTHARQGIHDFAPYDGHGGYLREMQ